MEILPDKHVMRNLRRPYRKPIRCRSEVFAQLYFLPAKGTGHNHHPNLDMALHLYKAVAVAKVCMQ